MYAYEYEGCDRLGSNRRYEDEPRYADPIKSNKYSLPEFHGELDPETYLEWESQVEEIFSLHHYSEGDKVKMVVAKFRGSANTWWYEIMRKMRLLGGVVKNWANLKELMKTTFVPKSYFIKLRGELQDLKQGAKNVMDYYHELLSLMRKVGIKEGEEETKDRFIHDININLKRKVEPKRLISLDLLLTYAKFLESLSQESATSRARDEPTQSQGIVETSKLSNSTKKRVTPPPKDQDQVFRVPRLWACL